MELVAGTVVGQKYALERPLAKGGMGSVWLARHLALEAPVAVKFMRDDDESRLARTRFENEAKAAAQLRSPHIVQILDYGIDEDVPYLVMEHLEGEDLESRLLREERLPLTAVARIVGEVAKGLKLAHDAQIVHRDLKPSNVFLARAGEEETAKLLDFGVAKVARLPTDTLSTEQGKLLGSPQYMSPEQASGEAVDWRSDLWSLALIAYVALTGHRPFAGSHVGATLVKICTAEIPPPTRFVPELPPGIDAFFAKALCRSPDGRFPSARVLADELAGIAGAPVPRAEPSLPKPVAPIAPRGEATGTATFTEAGLSLSDVVGPSGANRAWPVWRVAATIATGFLGAIAAWALWPAHAPREAPQASANASVASSAASSSTAEPPPTAPSAPASAVPSPSTSLLPSVTPPAPAPVSTFRTPRRLPQVRPPRQTPASSATVDPKFGLPVAR
jgi:serine/threonine-protein kinase